MYIVDSTYHKNSFGIRDKNGRYVLYQHEPSGGVTKYRKKEVSDFFTHPLLKQDNMIPEGLV